MEPQTKLDDLLDDISVMDVDSNEQTREQQNLDGWFAVVTEDGITAYFSDETSALRYRLAEINRTLNG